MRVVSAAGRGWSAAALLLAACTCECRTGGVHGGTVVGRQRRILLVPQRPTEVDIPITGPALGHHPRASLRRAVLHNGPPGVALWSGRRSGTDDRFEGSVGTMTPQVLRRTARSADRSGLR